MNQPKLALPILLILLIVEHGTILRPAFGATSVADVNAAIASVTSNQQPGILVAAAKKEKKARVVHAEEVEVDLSEASTEASVEAVKTNPHASGSGTDPHFSFLFDLLMSYRPGRESFSFQNFHPLLFFEIVPSPTLIFSFEVRPTPRYFELDYMITKALTLRVGRIWIPFDDMSPHNLFGGMINTSGMAFGTTAYLPDIWADLGFGAKYVVIDSKSLRIETQAYVVNGFGANATNTLPDFSNPPTRDNNDNKSIGGRLHFLISKTVGVGVSAYVGRWSNQAADVNPLTMLGLDAQLRLSQTELKLGVSNMDVSFSNGAKVLRTGAYIEGQQKLGSTDKFRLIARIGTQDTNNTVVDDSDNLIIGGGLRWRPNFITLSLEHYQDLKHVDVKTGYSFTFVRTSIQL